MADGGLTAREFWKLSPDERLKRCGELSDHEAFIMRLTDPHLPESPPCNTCKHYLGYAKCRAFPDGIDPDHIKTVMADPSIPCANGLRFEKKEGEE